MHEHRRGEPRRASGGGDRRLEPARRDEMGPAPRRQAPGRARRASKSPVAMQDVAPEKERRREPGREAAMGVRSKKRQDAVAGRCSRRDEEGDDRGDERGGSAMERAGLPGGTEGDEAGVVRRRRRGRLGRRAARGRRARGRGRSARPGTPQPRRRGGTAARTRAPRSGHRISAGLSSASRPKLTTAARGGARSAPCELDLAPRRWQKARAVTGLLDGQDGQRRLGRARQADPDRAPGLEAERRKRRRQRPTILTARA